jgi:superfamily I DNA/RNA helicase
MHSSKGLEFPVVFVISISTRIMPFYLAEQEGNTEEERRLFYVAMTRAEKQLHLSSISGHIGRFKVEPSYFLNESGIEVKKIANTFTN